MKRVFPHFFFCVCICIVILAYKNDIRITYAENNVIKVGYYDLGDYYTLDEEGNVCSYDTEYLNKVSEYADISFDYIDCGTWDNAIKMLEAHEIDLVGTMQKNELSQATYEMCNCRYAIAYATLVTLEDSDIIYKDYNNMSDRVIGCTYDYVNREALLEQLEANNIEAKILYYDTYEELEDALNSGEIHIAAANSHAIDSSWKIIDKYEFSPYYFASWRGNTGLIREIDEAILNIEMYENMYQEELLKMYFPSIINEQYTKEELDYIEHQEELTIYFEPNMYPIVYIDDNQQMNGILIDICNNICDNTGLNITYQQVKEENDYPYGDNEITFEVIFDDVILYKNSKIVTNSIFDSDYMFYSRSDFEYKPGSNKSYTVAIPKGRDGFRLYIESKYPEYEIVEYDGPSQCLEAVIDREVDFAFINYYIANDLIIKNNYKDINSIPTTSVSGGIALRVRGEDAQKVVSIINKAIIMTDEDEIQRVVLDYVLDIAPNTTISYFISSNPLVFVVIILIFANLVIILIAWIMRSANLKKQKIILSDANMKLEKASAAKTDFLSRMSHDIRTPMNAIIGMTALARDEIEDREVTLSYLDKIHSLGEFLLSLINDILDMSKIESNAVVLNKEPYSFSCFEEEIGVLVSPLCEKKNIKYVFEGGNCSKYSILVDKLRFRQIYLNLMSNAVRFTEEGGTIETTYRAEPVDDKRVRIITTVKDNGNGMSREFMEHMYEEFEQENNDISRKEAGTGLGLTIVKRLVELMGGEIEVESEIGVGTRFKIEYIFDIAEENVQDSGKTMQIDSVEEVLAGCNILLCEDNELNTFIAVKLLEKYNINVVTASTGAEGVEIYEKSDKHYFDAVLMDVRMPIMDGHEATRRIRALNRDDAKTVPIMAMTANAYNEDVEISLRAGMNAHLTKPIEPRVLYEELAHYIFVSRQVKSI